MVQLAEIVCISCARRKECRCSRPKPMLFVCRNNGMLLDMAQARAAEYRNGVRCTMIGGDGSAGARVVRQLVDVDYPDK